MTAVASLASNSFAPGIAMDSQALHGVNRGVFRPDLLRKEQVQGDGDQRQDEQEERPDDGVAQRPEHPVGDAFLEAGGTGAGML